MWIAFVVAALLAVATSDARPAGRCLVPGTSRTLDELWRPDVSAAIGYARTRTGDIAFGVRTQGRFYAYRPDHEEWSASVVKAMLLVTYLDSGRVRGRALSPAEQGVLGPMIRSSDNDDAQRIFDTVGQAGLRMLAARVGMTRFASNPVWGETRVTPRDQTRFFLHLDSFVVARHRSYAMRLLRSVIEPQRWGIGQLSIPGWKLYFKGGWGYGTGLEDHQVALLVRGCARVSIAVLTMYDGSHPYGKATLKAIFARLLRRFPTTRRIRTRAGCSARGAGRARVVGGQPVNADVLDDGVGRSLAGLGGGDERLELPHVDLHRVGLTLDDARLTARGSGRGAGLQGRSLRRALGRFDRGVEGQLGAGLAPLDREMTLQAVSDPGHRHHQRTGDDQHRRDETTDRAHHRECMSD